MAEPVSPTFHLTVHDLDLDKWRKMQQMPTATDRQVLASIKTHASRHLNEHFDRLGVKAWHQPK